MNFLSAFSNKDIPAAITNKTQRHQYPFIIVEISPGRYSNSEDLDFNYTVALGYRGLEIKLKFEKPV